MLKKIINFITLFLILCSSIQNGSAQLLSAATPTPNFNFVPGTEATYFNYATGSNVQTLAPVTVSDGGFHNLGQQSTVSIDKPDLTPGQVTIDPKNMPSPTSIKPIDSAVNSPTTPAGSPKAKNFGEFMNSPAGILIISGISTIYSSILYSAAEKQEKEANHNVDKVDQVIKAYKDSWVQFCPNGRTNLSEPNCYCYLENGAQNPDRTNSQVCKDLWAKNNYKITANADDYSGARQPIDPVGCLNVNGQFDEHCTCKKFIDAKGNNACEKSASIAIPNNSFGAGFVGGSGINDFLKIAANTSNGYSGLNLLSAGSLANKAIANQNLLKSMLSQVSEKNGLGKMQTINQNNIGQYANAILGEKAIKDAIANSKSPLAIATSGATDPKVSEQLNAAAAKAGLVEMVGSGHGLANKKEEKKDGMNFNFNGDSANGSNVQAQNFPEAQKNYNYKDSDISKQPDTSIFDIISNRYIQSGLKRLFDN